MDETPIKSWQEELAKLLRALTNLTKAAVKRVEEG